MSRCIPITGLMSRYRREKIAVVACPDCRCWVSPGTAHRALRRRGRHRNENVLTPVTGISAQQAPRYTLPAVSLRNPRCLSCPDLPRCPPPVFNSWRPTSLHWIWGCPCGRSFTPMRLTSPQTRPSTATAWWRSCIRVPRRLQIPRRTTDRGSASSRRALERFPRGRVKRLISPTTAVSQLLSASRG